MSPRNEGELNKSTGVGGEESIGGGDVNVDVVGDEWCVI